MTIQYYSQETLDALKEEHAHLEEKELPEASAAVGDARAKGDLKENAEYHAAREHLAFLQGRKAELESILAAAVVMDEQQINTSRVSILTRVTVLDKKHNKQITYQIVSHAAANLKEKKISVDSPIGKGLLGKKKGEKVTISTPIGDKVYEILDIQV
ncbi:MAG: transcription elongation factor GreA [Bacteroidota bacterium]